MQSAAIIAGEESAASADVAIDLVASGLDAAFVEAGNALAAAYGLVEELIATLAEVTGALDREAAGRAVTNMEMLAARIELLPTTIGGRAGALAAISAAANAVSDEVSGVGRTLDFLRICGLNIKVASGGQPGFSEFADQMLVRLDVSESEIRGIRGEVRHLLSILPSVQSSDRKLAAECAAVAEDAPLKLTRNALALRDYLQVAADRSDAIAAIAGQIRAHLADALGAMQIGDITRQRLEHIATGYRILVTDLGLDTAGDPVRAAAAAQVLAMLEAQGEETLADFRRECGRMLEGQQALAGEIAALLALQEGDGKTRSSSDLLHALERGVAAIGVFTERLQEADGCSQALGAQTAQTVVRLSERLSLVHQVTADVDNMAWNTDVRCFRMGQEGVGLAQIAREIRAFVGTLEAICTRVDAGVATLTEAAAGLAGGAASEAEGEVTLAQSLAIISEGARRSDEGIARLDRQAASAAAAVGGAVETVGRLDSFSAALETALGGLRSVQGRFAGVTAEANAEAQAVLDQIAPIYTMASERQLHRRFAAPDEVGEAESAPPPPDAQDEDDGLF
ncbi:chemotaxis protein [Sphingomonas rosea]|uniref:Chemotaxis protein n=2 Tax=Sphingomonas rosea TaxID=335605 RepID=A0ABP7U001_9SPHN